MGWSADQYLRFGDERDRAACDLLARVPLARPARVLDLGCGPGNSTALLAARYPDAEVMGMDSDANMIAAARKAMPGQCFELADIATWRPEGAPDLMFANASLQWVDDHATLFRRLVGQLAPGGVLAVQMPDNLDEPTHVAMREVAADPRWRDRLAGAAGQRKPLMTPGELYASLRPLCTHLDIWRTTYNFELAGIDAIAEWFKGSALRPYLEPLSSEEAVCFLEDWKDLIRASYPAIEGRCLLGFPRSFFVAQAC